MQSPALKALPWGKGARQRGWGHTTTGSLAYSESQVRSHTAGSHPASRTAHTARKAAPKAVSA